MSLPRVVHSMLSSILTGKQPSDFVCIQGKIYGKYVVTIRYYVIIWAETASLRYSEFNWGLPWFLTAYLS